MTENIDRGYDILTPDEAMKRLNVRRNAVYILLNSGELKDWAEMEDYRGRR